MADLRFKISGDSSPFIAEVYRSSDNRLVCKQGVNFCGIDTVGRENYSCVIINGLNQLTNYYVKLKDSLGRTTTSLSVPQTPANPIVKEIVANIQLLGVDYKVPTSLCTQIWQPETVQDGKGGKCIRFDPPLGEGQCVRVNLCAWTDPDTSLETGIVKVYKRESPSASYAIVQEVDDDACNFNVDIGEDETVCYDSCVIVGTHSGSGSYSSKTCLEILGTTPLSGVDTITSGKTKLDLSQTCIVPITTTTTSNTPFKVYFGSSRPLYNNCNVQELTKLCTYPALPTSGLQSFRVHFFMETYYSHDNPLSKEIQQEGKITNQGQAAGSLVTNTGNYTGSICTRTASFSKTITPDNIDDFNFYVCACDDLTNNIVTHEQYSCMCICKIDQQVGGTFSFGGSMPVGGSQGITVNTSAIGQSLIPLDRELPLDRDRTLPTLDDGTNTVDDGPTQIEREGLSEI